MKNSIEKSYADKVRELEAEKEKLKEACIKSWHIFINSLGQKLKLYDLFDWIANKFKSLFIIH